MQPAAALQAWRAWVGKVTQEVSLWTPNAAAYFGTVVDWAQREWFRWSRLTAAERAAEDQFDLGLYGQIPAPAHGVLEGQLRIALCSALLSKVSDEAARRAQFESYRLLLFARKHVLPTQDATRVAFLD